MHPSRERDLLPGVLGAECSGQMGSERGCERPFGYQAADRRVKAIIAVEGIERNTLDSRTAVKPACGPIGRRWDGNGLNLVMAYSWWKDRR